MTDTTNQNESPQFVEDSILKSMKQTLGLGTEPNVYDMDITLHINAVLSTLNQLGVGPEHGFDITSDQETWVDYLGSDPATGRIDPLLSPVKTYMMLRLRLLFDPPTTSFAIDAFDKQAKELEWRISAQADRGYISERTTG